jgi:hypothetical protein
VAITQETIVKLTDDMFAAIPSMVAGGQSREQIAALYGVSTNSLQVLCSRRGISLRRQSEFPQFKRKRIRRRNGNLPPLRVPLRKEILQSLEIAAAEFGKNTSAILVAALLEKITADRLYTAVLDE